MIGGDYAIEFPSRNWGILRTFSSMVMDSSAGIQTRTLRQRINKEACFGLVKSPGHHSCDVDNCCSFLCQLLEPPSCVRLSVHNLQSCWWFLWTKREDFLFYVIFWQGDPLGIIKTSRTDLLLQTKQNVVATPSPHPAPHPHHGTNFTLMVFFIEWEMHSSAAALCCTCLP